jgi:hypothetical protein
VTWKALILYVAGLIIVFSQHVVVQVGGQGTFV